jgi:hypothetical protein
MLKDLPRNDEETGVRIQGEENRHETQEFHLVIASTHISFQPVVKRNASDTCSGGDNDTP